MDDAVPAGPAFGAWAFALYGANGIKTESIDIGLSKTFNIFEPLMTDNWKRLDQRRDRKGPLVRQWNLPAGTMGCLYT